MSSDYKLAIAIGGKLDKSLSSAARDAQGILNQLNGGKDGIGKSIIKGMGAGVAKGVKALFVGSAASLAAMGLEAGKTVKDSVTKGMSYEAATSQLAATMGIDKSNADFIALDKTIQGLGESTNFTATEAAEAANILAMAGYDAQDNMAALPTVLHLAGAGAMEMDSAASYLTSTLASMGLDRTEENFSHVADVWARIASMAKTDVSGLGEAASTVGAIAAELPGGVNELAALSGVLANVNIEGSEAGTHIRNIMMSLQNPRNNQAADWFNELGISAYDTEGKMRPVMDIMGDIGKAMDGWTSEQKNAALADMFKVTDQAAVKALLGEAGKGYDELYEAAMHASDGVGAATQMYDTQTDNLQGDIDILSSAGEALNLSIYQSMADNLRNTVQEITNIVGRLNTAFKLDGLTGLAQQIGTEVGNIATELQTTGPQAIEAATNFATELVKSIGSEENSESIGGAAAAIITSVGTGFLNYTSEFGVAAGNLIKGLGQGLIAEDTAGQWTEALSGMITNIETWFTENGAEIGEIAGTLLGQLATGLATHSGEILQGGIAIIQGLAQGILTAIPILAGQLPTIILNLVNGVLMAVPNFVTAGGALAAGIVQGIADTLSNLGANIKDLIDSFVDENFGEQNNAFLADNQSQVMALVQQNVAGLTELSDVQKGYIEGWAQSGKEIGELGEEVNATINSMNQEQAGSGDAMAQAWAAFGQQINTVTEGLKNGTISTDEMTSAAADTTEEVSKQSSIYEDMVAEQSAAAMQTKQTAENAGDINEQFEQAKESVAGIGEAAQTALNPDVTSTLGPDALSGLLTSIDAGTIDGVVETLNTTMTTMQTTVSTAATAVQTSITTMSTTVNTTITTDFTAVQTTVETTMTASQTAAETAASGIVAAFASIDLAGIANNMMAGLVAGIQAGGAAAIAAAQSIASQIASVMSSALQIHSPSKVMEGIGNYVGLGLAGGMEQSAPTVYSAASSLAGTVGQGTTDSLSSSMNRLNAASAGSGGESSGSVTFAPQITITGNASEGDVRNALQWSMEQFRSMYERMKADDRRMAYA